MNSWALSISLEILIQKAGREAWESSLDLTITVKQTPQKENSGDT